MHCYAFLFLFGVPTLYAFIHLELLFDIFFISVALYLDATCCFFSFVCSSFSYITALIEYFID